MLYAGSSPRMRGKPDQRRDPVRRERIIPAHAGQTLAPFVDFLDEPDHPRACGANSQTVTPRSNMPGSSPRMRGKLPLLQHVLNGERIIPAHAGQTPAMPHRAGSSPDHPRACGANLKSRRESLGLTGSSPRMRGKLRRLGRTMGHRRIIPAHAGQTHMRPRGLLP